MAVDLSKVAEDLVKGGADAAGKFLMFLIVVLGIGVVFVVGSLGLELASTAVDLAKETIVFVQNLL